MSHRPGIGTGNPGKDVRQVARPVRVIVIRRDFTMTEDELASHFGTTFAGECHA